VPDQWSPKRHQHLEHVHSYMYHDSLICVKWRIIWAMWLIYMCTMTHSFVWNNLSCVRLIYMCDMTHSCVNRKRPARRSPKRHEHLEDLHLYEYHDSFICMTRIICAIWLIYMCDMTHSCMLTHSYAWHNSFTCVTWLIYMCGMTHLHVWHDSFTCVTRPNHVWIDWICLPIFHTNWDVRDDNRLWSLGLGPSNQ